MDNKRLGRGLEDIADIFISQKKENIPADGSRSVSAREAAWAPHAGHSHAEPGRRMPDNENGITTATVEKIKIAGNCPSTKKTLEHDQSERDGDQETRRIEIPAKDCPDVCEITEHVTSKKKMGYLNTPETQQIIAKSLFQYLRQNYTIRKIELSKVSEVSRPGMKNQIEENILIYIKEGENG
jgi:hypothetical protein